MSKQGARSLANARMAPGISLRSRRPWYPGAGDRGVGSERLAVWPRGRRVAGSGLLSAHPEREMGWCRTAKKSCLPCSTLAMLAADDATAQRGPSQHAREQAVRVERGGEVWQRVEEQHIEALACHLDGATILASFIRCKLWASCGRVRPSPFNVVCSSLGFTARAQS